MIAGPLIPCAALNSVSGADTYRLVVERLGASVGRVIDLTSTSPVTEFTPLTALTNGRYRAWVRVIGSFGELGQWSAAAEFRIT